MSLINVNSMQIEKGGEGRKRLAVVKTVTDFIF